MDTDITVIIDRSGSMATRTSDTIGGFNAWLKETAKGQQQGDDVRISVTIFDHVVEQSVVGVPLRACPKLGSPENPYATRGSTALLDAVGDSLTLARKRVDKDTRGLAVIITDGYENASSKWDHARIATLMAKLEKTGRWSFVYMGAGIDAWANARTFSPNTLSGQTVSYDPTRTMGAYTANAGVTASFLRGAQAQSASLGVETEAAMDETDEPKAKSK